MAGLPTITVGQTRQSGQSRPVGATDPVSLLIRNDDAGMSHSVRLALRELDQSGLPVSIPIMFPTPWHQATVELLQQPFNLVVTHVGIDDAELGALVDENADGPLAELIDMQGLKAMKRPGG